MRALAASIWCARVGYEPLNEVALDMKKLLSSLILGLFFSVSFSGKASDSINPGDLRLSVAMGYGVVDNPRANAEPIRTYLVPNLEYYGDSFYINNFTLGYSLLENETFYLDLQSRLNDDGLFFELDGLSGIFATDLFGIKDQTQPITRPGKPAPVVVYNKIERNVSYLGGGNFTWLSPVGDLSFGAFKDISGVHHGRELHLRYKYTFAAWSAVWGVELGLTQKDADLVRYYYQVTNEERKRIVFRGNPRTTLNSHVKFVVNKGLNEHWSLVTLLEYNRLGKGIAESALIDKSHYWTGLVGVSYAF